MNTYISREEAAKILHISTRTLDRYVQKKILKGHKHGRRIVFLRREVEAVAQTPSSGESVVVEQESSQNAIALPNEEIIGLTQLVEKMHFEVQKKDEIISGLHYELGKYQEIAKNSVPLLENHNQREAQKKEKEQLLQKLYAERRAKFIFLGLLGMSFGALGVLTHLLFGV